MYYTFEEGLQKVCTDLLLKKEDRISYNKDAEEIRNYLMDRMKQRDSAFRQAFKGLSLTGSYLDQLKIDLPDEFDMHMKLVMPFAITPSEDRNRPGFVGLNVDAHEKNRIVENGVVSRVKLQNWIREIMTDIIGSSLTHRCSGGRQYILSYPDTKRGFAVAHTVVANGVGNAREISFDFVPVFEFSERNCPLAKKPGATDGRSWFAVPQGRKPQDNSYEHTFIACAPHWERCALHDKMNLKNSLRLMKALRNNNNIPRLTSYMLKSVYLMELDQRSDDYWKQPMGQILIDMLASLVHCLDVNYLPFYLDDGLNHLDRIQYNDCSTYARILQSLLDTLKHYNHKNVQYASLAKIFVAGYGFH